MSGHDLGGHVEIVDGAFSDSQHFKVHYYCTGNWFRWTPVTLLSRRNDNLLFRTVFFSHRRV